LRGRLVKAMLKGRGRHGESLFEERHTDALGSSHGLQCCRRPRLGFDHLREEGETYRDDFPVLCQTLDRLVDKGSVLRRELGRFPGQCAKGLSERDENLAGVSEVEQVDQGSVLSLRQPDFQITHEAAGGQPEIVAHQHDGLHMLSVAVAQSGDELRVLLAPFGV
jgi:hypothetical protein